MRVVVALGGNAILRRGEPMTVANQRAAIAEACGPLAEISQQHELVVSHGNGPQVGLLALQAAAFDEVSAYPFDVLGAQTEGMIGYLIEQELGNATGNERVLVTLVTRTIVDREDPAFANPEKFVGPVYDEHQAKRLAAEHGWAVKPDGNAYRRVVPSPRPLRVVETQPVEWILGKGGIVICAGGGGVPTTVDDETDLMAGVEAVIDKDLASAVLARDIDADLLIIATDVDGVYVDWDTNVRRRVARAHPDAIDADAFPAGSMGPKVRAAQQFARGTGGTAVIGSLTQLRDIMAGRAGSVITTRHSGLETLP
ncbi:carbamate kinase [Aeromicrobium terrae]|uniref:Carbamate kinase n=1 Tax=Aeromicrobium terrae TaxID=2498846 RepID=A0A5C8NFX2_9ACTN|nr:carbamate kinase [Aeromicrobium terrae]TXL57510.1 carbamate kinase [Aeromicrobium terrae]